MNKVLIHAVRVLLRSSSLQVGKRNKNIGEIINKDSMIGYV